MVGAFLHGWGISAWLGPDFCVNNVAVCAKAYMCDCTSFPGWPVFLHVFSVNITLNEQCTFISALIVLIPLV